MTTKMEEKKDVVHQTDPRLPVYRPAADVIEREHAFLIVLDMPGVDEEHVDVELDRNVLTVKGTREVESDEGFEHLYRGYRPGHYERSFRLGNNLDLEHIKARVKNGVLRIELPKAESALPRKIDVKVEG